MLKRIFVPHKGNGHRPHILREAGAIVAVAVIVGIFGLGVLQKIALTDIDLLARIIPTVLVDLANENRTANNLLTLTPSTELAKAAQMKADDMAQKGYFSHVSPDGLSPWHWMTLAGYQYQIAGENLAVNFSDSGLLDRAWMDSPTHRANILNAGFTEIGIATANGSYKGRDTTFVVEMVGRRAPPTTATTNIPANTDSGINTNIRYASAVEHAVASPSATTNMLYATLASLIAFSILFMIALEVSRKHTKHIAIGLALLVMVGISIYVFREALLGGIGLV